MGSLESANRSTIKQARISKAVVAGLALAAASICWPSRGALADVVYDGSDSTTSDRPYIDGGDWFNPDNWDNAASVPVVNGVPNSTDIVSVSAATGFVGAPDPNLVVDGSPLVGSITDGGGNAVEGAVFDPVGFGVANPAAPINAAALYLSSSPGKIGSFVQPNVLTIKSGTLEISNGRLVDPAYVAVGRGADAEIIQTGGTFAADGALAVGGGPINSGTRNGLTGVGIYDYRGGVLLGGISTSGVAGNTTFSDYGLRLGQLSGDVGVMKIHHSVNSFGNLIQFDNMYVGYVQGGVGVLNYYLENGGVTTINVNGLNDALGGQLDIRNYSTTPTFGTGTGGSNGTIGSVLDITLNSAPALSGGVPQNLALITYTSGIRGNGSSKDFFSGDGTDLTEGSEISATYNGFLYTWKLYYDGSINGTIGANIPSGDILQTGGNTHIGGSGAVVLIGESVVAVPEPASIALLGGACSLFLARRRRLIPLKLFNYYRYPFR